ncbi:MAG: hypothetical protein HC821_04475 [Lewinella sp.]|nr:hypothetical protein [Lewinella sp.]
MFISLSRSLVRFSLLLALSNVTWAPLKAESPPPSPTFLDPTPADLTVSCYNNRPADLSLNAQTDAGVVAVPPRDSLSSGSALCSGGVLFRIWEITTPQGSVRTQQSITFGPSNAGPSINPSINNRPDTVECSRVNNPTDPLNYQAWLTRNQVRIAAAILPGCAPVVSITNNAPPDLAGVDCDDRTAVIYTVTDQCGVFTTVVFNYVITDRTPPQLIGVPANLTINCHDPLPDRASVTVQDCNPNPMLVFNEINNRGNSGCSQFEYQILRTWTAVDSCGNSSSRTQTISVVDDEQPSFQVPFDEQLLCTQNFNNLDLTGRPTQLNDNCTPIDQLMVSHTDNIIYQPNCNFNFNIQRTWRVVDLCGNSSVQVQNIFVADNQPPNFTAPPNVAVRCDELFNFDLVGRPFNLFDNCTENPNTEFTDQVLPGSCPQSYQVRRNWRIFDNCGNSRMHVQNIDVVDTVGPTFATPPTDLITSCNNELFQDLVFNQWVNNFAGARPQDGCSPDSTLLLQIFVSGTTQIPIIPPFTCDAQDGTVRKLLVDVIATDQCGNQTLRTVEFRQIDTLAPILLTCPTGMVVATDPGECDAALNLPLPTVIDQCVTGFPAAHRSRDTVIITSNAAPGQQGVTPVNAIVLNLPAVLPLPLNALMPSTLTLRLVNVDAEGSEEFFFIYDEDNNLLGTTERTQVQCGSVSMTFTIPQQEFNLWAADGMITFRLVPNIPSNQLGSFAINNLCVGISRVEAELLTTVRRLSPIDLVVSIDDELPFTTSPLAAVQSSLEQGIHQVRYQVVDCAGNTSECSYSVTVEDQEAPEISCPGAMSVVLANDSCVANRRVALPLAAQDNCSIYETQRLLAPAEGSGRLFRFSFDPNLNSYQAQPIVASFPPIAPYAFDTVEISVHYQGDFSSPSAILDVLTDDGILLGSTAVGEASCSATGQLRLRLTAAQFNALVGDGTFGLVMSPRPVVVPPGVSGDGVNPCSNTVGQDGENDGLSYAFAELSYQILRPIYFATGATTVGPSSTSEANPQPVVDLNVGETNFTYVLK